MGLFKKKEKQKTEEQSKDEFAEIIPWKPQWDTGAPMPQVFSNGHKIYLIYLINEPDPKWDGTYVNMIDNTGDTEYPLALVEFNGGTSRFGIANEDVFGGLPIANKGMEWYSAHIIHNSTWLEELKVIHSVHPYYNEEHWKDKKHYMLLFHDEMFEAVATDYKIETFRTTFEILATEVAKRMNK